MHTDLAPTQLDGTAVNEKIYKRNEFVKNTYNCDIVAHNDAPFYSMSKKIITLVLSQTCEYDAAYSEGTSVNSLISQGILENLSQIPELQLNENWWSKIVNEQCTLGAGKYECLFFTQSNLSLTAFDLTWCVYFNKQMHENAKMENLYQLVRDDKWTIEKMKTLSKEMATLNGDESFAYDPNGNAVYGMTTYWNGVKAMLIGGNAEFVKRNTDGDFEVKN